MTQTKAPKIRTRTIAEYEASLGGKLGSPEHVPPDERRKPLTTELVLKHLATIGRLNQIMENCYLHHDYFNQPGLIDLETYKISGFYTDQIDLRGDIPAQVSAALGIEAEALLDIKQRVDQAIAAGEFPRKEVQAVAVVREDEIFLTDAPRLAVWDAQEYGGTIEYRFTDDTSEPVDVARLKALCQ